MFFGSDPYCYFAEPGLLHGVAHNKIKKMLGCASADACITVKLILSASHVWIRVKRGYPVKFAIEAHRLPVNPPKSQKGFRIAMHGAVEYRTL